VTGTVGAVLGSAATLITKVFQITGLQDLLKNDPYVGVTVLALLAGLIVLVLGLALSRALLAAAAAGVLLVASMAFWFIAPLGFDIPFQAEPEMKDVPALKIVGAVNKDVDLVWNAPQMYHAERAHRITLNAQPLKDYFSDQMAHCVTTLRNPTPVSVAVVSRGGY
jgi:hypothetical protein